MVVNILFLFIGFVTLVKGADLFVEGSSSLAVKFKVSDLAIGLTVVAIGTSLPELVVNVFAAYKGHCDIVFGNIIGSNNFNIFVVLGVIGMFTPFSIQPSTLKIEIPVSFLVISLFFLFANDLFFSKEKIFLRGEGFLFLILFISFLFYVYVFLKKVNELEEVKRKDLSLFKTYSYIFLGIFFLTVGGHLVETKSVLIAEFLGVSQGVIGLTVVAMGTSLPEFVTSLIAVIKKKKSIAVGNIIGSNISNILFILGTSAIVKPQTFNIKFNIDIAVMAVGTLLFFLAIITSKSKRDLERWKAGAIFLLYIIYIISLVVNEITK